MGTKANPGKYDCYANALEHEPMFILLARDTSAPDVVRLWAQCRGDEITFGARPESDRAMIDEANECARAMEKWRAANEGIWRQRALPVAGEVWRHRKGGRYEVRWIARLEATNELAVIYSPIAGGDTWVRSMEDFMMKVDGEYRFVKEE